MQYAFLTRRPEENTELAAALKKSGYEIIEQPLISFQPNLEALKQAADEYSNFDLVITSKYAAEIIAKNYPIKSSCFVVGTASANLLKNAGFKIKYIAPRAEQLFKELNNHKNDNLLYLRGNVITKETPPYIKEAIIYQTSYLESFNKNILDKITSDNKGLIFLFSIKTAETFAKLIKHHALQTNLNKVTVITLSQAITTALKSIRVKTFFAPASTNEAIIKIIKKIH